MTLGLCMPLRPRVGEPGYERPERWGCLREPLYGAIWQRLAASADVQAIEIRDAWSDGGTVRLGDRDLTELDGLFWYCEVDRRSGSYELELLKTLARRIPVHPDPWRWEQAVDKYTAHLVLRAAGIRVPDFVLVDPERPAAAIAALEQWGAALLKPRRGAWGKGVLLVEHPASLRDLAGYLSEHGVERGLYLERYLDNVPDRWVSVTTLGGVPVYGYQKRCSKRVPLPGGRYKVFDADQKGGEVDYLPLDAKRDAIARQAAAALGCPIVGFDMIEVEGEPVIIDENTSPGNYADVYAAAGVDPAEAFATAILGCFEPEASGSNPA